VVETKLHIRYICYVGHKTAIQKRLKATLEKKTDTPSNLEKNLRKRRTTSEVRIPMIQETRKQERYCDRSPSKEVFLPRGDSAACSS
jgi:hypothetical protein